jgi:hypothetical protein
MAGKKSTKSSESGKGGAAALPDSGGRAAGVVLAACAAMSHHIAIVGWNPPRTAPEDALRMTLGEIGINELEELRELLKTLAPEESSAGIDEIEIKSGTKLGDLITAVAAKV